MFFSVTLTVLRLVTLVGRVKITGTWHSTTASGREGSPLEGLAIPMMVSFVIDI